MTRTSLRATTLGAIMLVALLAGCTGGPDPDPTDGTAETPGATAAPDGDGTEGTDGTDGADSAEGAPMTVRDACTALYVGGGEPLERVIGDALVSTVGELDEETLSEISAVGIRVGAFARQVPDELRPAVEQVRVPFLQLQEHFDLRDSDEIELDIASARDGLAALRDRCADEGFAFGS